MNLEMDVRRLRHRLKCVGMAELDVWLSSLNDALDSKDLDVIAAIDALLQRESPELLYLMEHQDDVPELLKRWLS